MTSEYSPEMINYYLKWFSEWMGAPSNLLQTIAEKESSYNPITGDFKNTCNSKNACGLMQLRPPAIEEARRMGYNVDPLNPIQAIVGAVILFYKNDQYMGRYIRPEQMTWPIRVVGYNGGYQVGVRFFRTGQLPPESYKYLAYVGPRTGIV